jgi:tetratricopeptide (TPR) repeat protein
MNAGQDALRNGQYTQAVALYRKLVSRDPSNFEGQFNLAFAYLSLDRRDDALREFKKAGGLNPRSAEVWCNIGIIHQRMGKNGNAIDAFTKAVQLDPANLEARLNLASVYAETGRHSEAIAQFKQVVAIDGKNSVALTNLAKLLVAQKNTEEAKHYVNLAIQNNPEDAEAHWEMGNILFRAEKKIPEALKEYRLAVTLQANSEVYYDDLGKALEASGDNAGAIEVYKKYLIYLNDIMKKEEIQNRIDNLENPGGQSRTGQPVSRAQNKEDVNRLRDEVRGDQPSDQTVNVGKSSDEILGDLNSMGDDGSATLDLKAEAKKKAGKSSK